MDESLWSLSLSNRDREIQTGLMYAKFRTAITENLSFLEKLSTRDLLNQIAWLARNLLELLVWVKYCSSSQARAREFWDDSIRDLYSLIDPKDENDPDFLSRLGKAVAMIGPEKDPKAWTRTSRAAKAIKQLEYERTSQTLSKFVHPTAMSILLRLPLQSRRIIQKGFVESGRAFASEALQELEGSLMAALYNKYKSSIQKALKSPEGKSLEIGL